MAGEHAQSDSVVKILSWTSGVPEFALPAPTHLMSIAVYEEESGQPIWIVVSSKFSAAPGQAVSGQPYEINNDDEEQHEPDSRSSDVRVAELAREAGVRTAVFTYGLTPNGFQQIVPSTGEPEPLKDRAEYLLTINGERSFRLTFRASHNKSS